jgi:hypothetical protein
MIEILGLTLLIAFVQNGDILSLCISGCGQ